MARYLFASHDGFGLGHVRRAARPPNLEEVRQALGRIVKEGRRAGDVISRIRALVAKAAPRNDQLDINEVMLDVIALTGSELRDKNPPSIFPPGTRPESVSP